jgi:cytochrome P450
MIYDLVHAQIDDPENPVLTPLELFEVIRAFIVAGNETTTTAIGNGLLILLKNPDLLERVRNATEDSDRVFSRLTEEILRTESPVQGLPRMTTEDTELNGVKLPKGSHIFLAFASANRDDAKFEDPDRVMVDRKNAAQHLALGGGIHRCVGAMLARMEIKVSMREIVRRLDNIKLEIPEIELAYAPSMVVRSLVTLPVSFTAR